MTKLEAFKKVIGSLFRLPLALLLLIPLLWRIWKIIYSDGTVEEASSKIREFGMLMLNIRTYINWGAMLFWLWVVWAVAIK
jgi:hypothetical protein